MLNQATHSSNHFRSPGVRATVEIQSNAGMIESPHPAIDVLGQERGAPAHCFSLCSQWINLPSKDASEDSDGVESSTVS